MALWAHHLGVPASAVADPVCSRRLWDTASTRHVCRYDPDGGHDAPLSDRPDFIVDPSDRQPGDPCRTLLPTSRAPGPSVGRPASPAATEAWSDLTEAVTPASSLSSTRFATSEPDGS